jgi:hypothetical protein
MLEVTLLASNYRMAWYFFHSDIPIFGKVLED